MLDAKSCVVNLFFQCRLVQRHHQYVIDIDLLACMVEYPYDVGEIIGLMTFEKIIRQVKRFEGQVGPFLVGISVAKMERVITYREIGPGRIEYTQVPQAPRCRDFKQQVFEE